MFLTKANATPHEGEGEAIDQSQDAPCRSGAIHGKVVTEQSMFGADHLLTLQHQDKRRQTQDHAGHRAQEMIQRHPVELRKGPVESLLKCLRDPIHIHRSPTTDLLVILLVGAHAPQVMLFSQHQGAHRQHAGEHRVVLVVVAGQPIAADRLHILQAIDESPNGGEVFAVVGVVHRIGLRHADYSDPGDLFHQRFACTRPSNNPAVPEVRRSMLLSYHSIPPE
jgi:hypothetical protein